MIYGIADSTAQTQAGGGSGPLNNVALDTFQSTGRRPAPLMPQNERAMFTINAAIPRC